MKKIEVLLWKKEEPRCEYVVRITYYSPIKQSSSFFINIAHLFFENILNFFLIAKFDFFISDEITLNLIQKKPGRYDHPPYGAINPPNKK